MSDNRIWKSAALAVLPLVDLVTGWGGESAVDSIRALRPDVLVQAGGGLGESIPGGDMLQEWGGELRFAAAEQLA